MCERSITGYATRCQNTQSRLRLVVGTYPRRPRRSHQVRRHQRANSRPVHQRKFYSGTMESTLSSRPNRDDQVIVQEEVDFYSADCELAFARSYSSSLAIFKFSVVHYAGGWYRFEFISFHFTISLRSVHIYLNYNPSARVRRM